MGNRNYRGFNYLDKPPLEISDQDRDLLETYMPKIIAEATYHTKHVGLREHHKADRIERVCLFVTDLRRLAAYARVSNEITKAIRKALTDKAIWVDAGLLDYKAKVYTLGNWMSYETVRRWVDASKLVPVPEPDEVEDMFSELYETVYMSMASNREAQRITTLAEQVATDIVEFCESAQ
jgi:hypothetical protein